MTKRQYSKANCLVCKGATDLFTHGKHSIGCILSRNPNKCSGPFKDWSDFWLEAEKKGGR